MPEQDFIVIPDEPSVTVALEPVQNAIHSLLLLTKAEHVSGFSDWVTQTVQALSPQEREQHYFVIIGFFHAIAPERTWSSFPAYLDYLATCEPDALRDRMLAAYAKIPPLAEQKDRKYCDESRIVDFDFAAVLKDADSYLDFLRERFDADHIDEELEARAYTYAVDPPAMQALIVSHLREMWDKYLAAEWERVEPMLRDSVRAFQQVDFSNMSRYEAARFITGQELAEEKWQWSFERAERVVFVPTTHVGPYLGKFWEGKTFGVLFGARLPEGVSFDAPDLSRAEIVMRLGALADDTRLRLLKLVSEKGELYSKDIMDALGLSQSATSRHLKQLSATGYLSERRCNGAKCYQLNPERIQGTLRAVEGFLLSE
jgi:DNA-binding transcriptional ArsR family regulator